MPARARKCNMHGRVTAAPWVPAGPGLLPGPPDRAGLLSRPADDDAPFRDCGTDFAIRTMDGTELPTDHRLSQLYYQ